MFALGLIIILGMLFCPYFTIGILLLQLNHSVLAGFAFSLSILSFIGQNFKTNK